MNPCRRKWLTSDAERQLLALCFGGEQSPGICSYSFVFDMPRKQTLIARRDLPIFVKQETAENELNCQQLLSLANVYPRQQTQSTSTTTADFTSYVNTEVKCEFGQITSLDPAFSEFQLVQGFEKPQVTCKLKFLAVVFVCVSLD